MRYGLMLLSVALLGCSDTQTPAGPDFTNTTHVQPQYYIRSDIAGPADIYHLGWQTWTVDRDVTTCVIWERRTGAGDWTEVEADDPGSSSSSYSEQFTDPNTADFELRATGIYVPNNNVCVSGFTENTVGPFSVTVHSPLAAELQTTFTGPEFIFSDGNYEWSVSASGGTGTYSYSWYLTYVNDPQNTYLVSNNANYSQTVTGCDGDLRLDVTVTSGDQSQTYNQYVFNMASCL